MLISIGSILDLKPEAFQTALNVTAVGALVASQEVSLDRQEKRNHQISNRSYLQC